MWWMRKLSELASRTTGRCLLPEKVRAYRTFGLLCSRHFYVHIHHRQTTYYWKALINASILRLCWPRETVRLMSLQKGWICVMCCWNWIVATISVLGYLRAFTCKDRLTTPILATERRAWKPTLKPKDWKTKREKKYPLPSELTQRYAAMQQYCRWQ